MKRYLIGVSDKGNIGMALEDYDPEVVFDRIMRVIKQGPAICWHVTDQSPFGHGR